MAYFYLFYLKQSSILKRILEFQADPGNFNSRTSHNASNCLNGIVDGSLKVFSFSGEEGML